VVRGDAEFWTRLVPQLSQVEPSIRYAAVAIGALLMQHRPTGFTTIGSPARTALTYYNKAIKQLLDSANEVDKELALVSNVLFTCIECIQGNDTEAIGLFHQGRRMFEEYWDSAGQLRPVSEVSHAVRNLLARLRILAMLYGPAMFDYPSPLSVRTPGLFQSYEDARTELFYLTGDCHEVISEGSRARLSRMPQAEILAIFGGEKTALQTRLHYWKSRFWHLLEPSLYPAEQITDHIAVLTLQCQFIIMGIWLDCCLDDSETAFDAHRPAFQRLINTSDMVLQLLQRSDLRDQPFTLEIGLIAPLYLAVRKCRDPELRRAGIDLIRRGRKQEGLWEAKQIARILDRIVEIEEDGQPGYWPAESARLQATLLLPRSTNASGNRGNIIQFYRQSSTRGEAWEIWEEWYEAMS
jgi:hypothetical protein